MGWLAIDSKLCIRSSGD